MLKLYKSWSITHPIHIHLYFSFRLRIVYVNQICCDHSLGDEIPWDVLERIRLFIPSKGNCIMQWYFLDQRHVNLLFGAGIGSYCKRLKFSIDVLFINSTFLNCTEILSERNRFYISNKSILTKKQYYNDFILLIFSIFSIYVIFCWRMCFSICYTLMINQIEKY